MDRRTFGMSLAALAAAQVLPDAQAPTYIPLRVLTMNSIGLLVSDVTRSVEWYQRVFGMPVMYQDRPEGRVAILALGDGPEHLALWPANGAKPTMKYLGLGVKKFDRKHVQSVLDEHKVKTNWTARKAPQGNVDELMVQDPDGIWLQIQDSTYCGGGGLLGNQCSWTPAPKGKLPPVRTSTWNHLSFNVSDDERSYRFYTQVVDLRLRTVDYRQKDAIRILGVADTPQTINPMEGGGGGFGHFCFSVDNFDYDRVAKQLNDLGIKIPPAAASRPTCCGRSVVYNPKETIGSGQLKDPDGIGVQLTDTTFCGGSGRLGEVCP